jgi:hypothetical protein
MRPYIPFILLLGLSACSVTAAQMALPVGVAQSTSPVAITGIGGSQGGTLLVGTSSGRFSRRADRLGVFDPLFVSNHGMASFDIAGPDVTGAVSARCGFARRQMALGVVTITPGQLRYACQFRRNGAPMAASLELQGRGGVLGRIDGREPRDGVFEYEGVRLAIRSVHRVAGSPLPLPHPIGYTLAHEGREVAAVDLNGPVKQVHAPADPALREAVLVASLALATFWDPAEVDPGQ